MTHLNAMADLTGAGHYTIDCLNERGDAMIIAQHQSELQEYVGDDWLLATQIDYLETIRFDNLAEAVKYSGLHCCPECREQLITVLDEQADRYQAVCPFGHDVTRKTAPLKREIELMAELGF